MPRVVTFGEIMLRLSPPGHLRLGQAHAFDAVYGGGEANVAASLALLGLDSRFVTRLPTGPLGDAARDALRQRGVDVSEVLRGGERLGIYFLEVGAVQRGSNVIYDRVDSAFAKTAPGAIDWDAALAGADQFHWTGITPAVSADAAEVCAEAVRAANRLGVPVSVDLNYRSKLWAYGADPRDVMPALVEGCDLVVAGASDAEALLGIGPDDDVPDDDDEAQYRSLFAALRERFPRCRACAATVRHAHSASHNTWSAVYSPTADALLTTRAYEITDIVDRVGGGDSFMAGLLYGRHTYPDDPQHALDFAVAASALKHTIFGDVNLARADEVEALLAGDGSGRVNR